MNVPSLLGILVVALSFSLLCLVDSAGLFVDAVDEFGVFVGQAHVVCRFEARLVSGDNPPDQLLPLHVINLSVRSTSQASRCLCHQLITI